MLSTRDTMCLDIAGAHYRYSGSLENAARELVGMSLPVFARHVSALIRTPEAEAARPALVHRLRRLEDARREVRSRRPVA
jgi:hypothetical protein